MEALIEKRTDYTFKHNIQLGRHGWLRLTPAYSVKLVAELIHKDCKPNSKILDPFSGTATTGLVASELGFKSVLFDINPFLIWFGNTKCKKYSVEQLESLHQQVLNICRNIKIEEDCWIPSIFNIERWWHRETILILSSIRRELVDVFGEPNNNSLANLIWVAFCRLAIETSSADFNHVSMSFKESSVNYELPQIRLLFDEIFNSIFSTAKKVVKTEAIILKGNSRDLSKFQEHQFDVVITSPPYPNRISYIRELRPYMYWTKFLQNGSDAGDLDWEAIGGTWGIATSNLKGWKAINSKLPERVYQACEKINSSGDKNSNLMSLYVHKYFDDMFGHLKSIRPLLKTNAKVNYIVGNSSFYGNFVDTEKIFADMLAKLGFAHIEVRAIRRRNTKKGLFEFNVSASWG